MLLRASVVENTNNSFNAENSLIRMKEGSPQRRGVTRRDSLIFFSAAMVDPVNCPQITFFRHILCDTLIERKTT